MTRWSPSNGTTRASRASLPKDYARPALDKQRLGRVDRPDRHDRPGRRRATAPRTFWGGSTSTSYRSSPAPRARRAASSTRRAASCGCWSKCSRPTRAGSSIPAAVRAACSSSREKFVEAHGGRIGDIAIYGQESNPTTWRLAKMNLAIRGIDGNLGPEHADSFPPRPAQGPEGRLRAGQSAVQRQRLGRPARYGRTSAGSTAPRRPAMPTLPGSSTSSITWRPTASPVSCWPTAR